MSCYLRHIEDILKEAGIKLTKENRKAVDEKIHEIVKVKYKYCPKAWKVVKERILKDRKEFVETLKGSVV